jgi:cell division protein FtsZ
MIPYSRDPQQTIPPTAVKIIGLGGAGANMLERIALDGMEGAELLALNTDVRTLNGCVAREKIQLGVNLTKGLGSGGDPELGQQAILESEEQIRASIKGRRIVFVCTGLGGGTGSGAAPIVTRIAREEGAFVVVFATMPFAFEGKRRREQAETSLNQLAVISNALVTFDNNRMGELVLAKQGIHEAFAAADHMICESIKAVIRLVIRPGLINVGLDDLMSALRTNRSRCLFGSGIANGKDRATRALKNALSSPLLDQGALLKDAQTVLVHLSGGEDLTLFEIELLMQRLQKFVPEKAHVLFGAAIDPAMGDALSITLISALPEDSLAMAPRESISHRDQESIALDPSQGFTPPYQKPAEPTPGVVPDALEPSGAFAEIRPVPVAASGDPVASSPLSKFRKVASSMASAVVPSFFEEQRPFAEPETQDAHASPEPEPFSFAGTTPTESQPLAEDFAAVRPADTGFYSAADEPDPEPIEESDLGEVDRQPAAFIPGPKRRPSLTSPWAKPKGPEFPEDLPPSDLESPISQEPAATPPTENEPPKLKLGIKPTGSPNELSLDSAPRGRFEGESPNVVDGEDLDLPPFLRKKK